ncbi:prophage tail fiber N-terminal domain-containing protein [Orbus wheelerorum]|uniref:prophage tail fiber N-terminal domain-containing protein n=1 Tax=Orbus wheelerorum TaxID=3074111 RepID=UPI00370D7D51
MAKLSGKLIDGASQIIADAVIELRSLKNTNTVLNKVISATTTEEGFYSIDAQIGKYEVAIVRSGFSPVSVGIIDIYADSLDGSLNDYLLNPNENEITPEILAQVSALRDDSKKFALNAENAAKSIQDIKTSINDAQVDVKQAAQQANDAATLAQQAKESAETSSLLASDSAKTANQAKQEITDQISVVKQLVSEVETTAQTVSEAEDKASLSALNAKNSEQEAAKFAQQAELSASNVDLSNTLKLTGGRLTGDLFINDKKVLVDGDVNQFNGGIVTGDTNFTAKLQASKIDVSQSVNIGEATIINNRDTLFINDKKILVDGDVNQFNGGTVTGDTNFTGKLQQNGNDILTQGVGGLYSKAPLLKAGTSLTTDDIVTSIGGQSFTLAGYYKNTPFDNIIWAGILKVDRCLYDAGSAIVLTIYNSSDKYLNAEYRNIGGLNVVTGEWVWSGWREIITSGNIPNYRHGIGINQRWQNVTENRFNGVIYVNTTGSPIVVSLIIDWTSETYMDLWVQGSWVAGQSQQSSSPQVKTMTTIIPVGADYCSTWTNTGPAKWLELR